MAPAGTVCGVRTMPLRRSARDRPCLQTQVGHRHNLPEGAARNRTEGQQIAIYPPTRVYRFRLRGHIDTQPVPVGPDKAAGEQQMKQGLARAQRVALGSGAVDQPCEPAGSEGSRPRIPK